MKYKNYLSGKPLPLWYRILNVWPWWIIFSAIVAIMISAKIALGSPMQ